jgi:hypothetical protein
MSERIKSQYRSLVEVRVFHHYWLDDGNTLFDSVTLDPYKQPLADYDVRKFLAITPTATTEKKLKGLSAVFKTNALGFVVLIPEHIIIPNDAFFEFVITVTSLDFFNYTALTLQPQTIIELYHKKEDKVYRYKTNVPFLSNKSGVAKTIKNQKQIFLSHDIPIFSQGYEGYIESLFQKDGKLVQFIDDKLNLGNPLYNGTADFPIFVNQLDIPFIDNLATHPLPSDFVLLSSIKPEDIPHRGIKLSDDIPDNVFALIKLVVLKDVQAVSEFDLCDLIINKDKPKDIPPEAHVKKERPVFHIHFKNRSTEWHYYDKRLNKTDQPFMTEPLPLTFFGNAQPNKKRKPSEGFVKPKVLKDKPNDDQSASRLRLISEIFE